MIDIHETRVIELWQYALLCFFMFLFGIAGGLSIAAYLASL